MFIFVFVLFECTNFVESYRRFDLYKIPSLKSQHLTRYKVNSLKTYSSSFLNADLCSFTDDKHHELKALLLCGGISNRINGNIDDLMPPGVPKCKQFIYIHQIPLFIYSFTELLRNSYINEVIIVTRPEWYKVVKLMLINSKSFIENLLNGRKIDVKDGSEVNLNENLLSSDGYDDLLSDDVTELVYDFSTFDFGIGGGEDDNFSKRVQKS